MGGCCCRGLSFDSIRKAEGRLLQHVGENLKGRGKIVRRDVLLEVEDPVVSHAIVHFLELLPAGLGVEPCQNADCFPNNYGFKPIEVETANEGNVAFEKTPLVLLPGFGIGAAAFAPCMEHLVLAFPDRHIFLLDWPSSGAAPRMPFTHEAKDKFMKNAAKVDLAKSAVVYRGVVHVCSEETSGPVANQNEPYPLPEKRFITIIEAWRKHLGISKMILLGHSIGGFICFSYAEAFPQYIERLLLCSPCGLPVRPDAFGISEAAFSDWMEQIDEEEPQYANEFRRGAARPAIKYPKWTICDRLLMCAFCALCPLLFPFICLAFLCGRLKRCLCGPGKRPSYQKTFPHNGMSAGFECEWKTLPDLNPLDYERIYVSKAIPPPSRARSVPGCVGRRCAELFAEMRFADNGQWLESRVEWPADETCMIVAGGDGLPESRTGAMASTASGSILCTKVSRKLLADYEYYISAFLPCDFNWGEKLFESIQFNYSYRSYGWSRRPIGKRVEEFLGLPQNFESGSEFYTAYNPIPSARKECGRDVVPSGNLLVRDPIPVAFFYGKSDWMPFRAAKLISEKVARHSKRNVPVLLLNHAGHQMFLDSPKGFIDGVQMVLTEEPCIFPMPPELEAPSVPQSSGSKVV